MSKFKHFLFATTLGALTTVLYPAGPANAEGEVALADTCTQCSPTGEYCVASAAGFTSCTVLNGKCTIKGFACGISSG